MIKTQNQDGHISQINKKSPRQAKGSKPTEGEVESDANLNIDSFSVK